MDRLLRFFGRSHNKKGYWIGPYNMYVPNAVNSVVAADGSNIWNKDGEVTQKDVLNPMTKETYLGMYADLKDGDYYFRQAHI